MARLVSVIIPIYNHVDVLPSVLLSLEKQTYAPIEVIIVDDGSDRAVELPKTPLPVRLVQQAHAGAPAARNSGFRESHGEYVIFWDADALGESSMIAKMVHALEEHPEASYAYSNWHFGRKKMPAGPFDPKRLRQMNYITTMSVLRRDAFPGFDESLKKFQDWDLWLTMLKQGKTGVWIPEYLFKTVPHKSGMSAWLPSFAYQAPWKYLPGIRMKVRRYETARTLIRRKHGFEEGIG